MTPVSVPRPHVGSGVELFASTLTVPYAAGMHTQAVPLSGGRLQIAGPRREPVVLARLRRALADEAVVVRIVGDADPPSQVLFAPFTAEGTLLPMFVPQLAADGDGTGDVTVAVTVHLVSSDQRYLLRPETDPALTDAEAGALIEGVVLEGRLARLLYLATLGSQRAIRMAREIAATRHQSLACAGALDDTGMGLGVPRRIADEPEDDERYRARLAIYGRHRLPTPARFAQALNGPGDDDDPNAGLPASFGIEHRFRIVEDTNELAIATKLVAVGGAEATAQRDQFHQALRAVFLVDLRGEPSSLLPAARRDRMESIRSTIRAETTRPDGPDEPRYLAPLVAATLDRAVRLMRGLGLADPITLNRAYDPAGGSRYELGLGVDLAALGAAQLDAMAAQVPVLAADASSGELSRLAQTLSPRPVGEDPLGRWLFEPCGFRTVHPSAGGAVHLSPLPTYGQIIDGPDDLDADEVAEYRARRLDENTATGIHVQARDALASSDDVFDARGLGDVPPTLAPDELSDVLQTLAAAAASPVIPDTLDAAAAAGVVSTEAKGLAIQIGATMNLDQIVALEFSVAALAAFGTSENVRDALIERVDALTEAGFYSARAIWDGGRLLLLASISQLPGASVKVGVPPPASFRWYVARVPDQPPGTSAPVTIVQPRGGKTQLRGAATGLALVVCVGYARRGLADPFEVRIELADPTALLNLEQYGFVMNLVEHLHPVGIEINTFDLRRRHVDTDGDGAPEFLTSRASRSYHRYRHRRPFGAGRGRQQRGSRT